MQDDHLSTAAGLLRCLQALAEETASIGLMQTYMALGAAIDACRLEAGLAISIPGKSANSPVIH